MQRFQGHITLYIVSLLITSVALFGGSESLSCGSRLTLEVTQTFFVPRLMKMGGNSDLTTKRHPTQTEEGKKGRKSKKTDSPSRMTLTLQQRRRSGRLMNLYWKDLSGISSETNPIILDSDSSDTEEEEKKGVDANYSEENIEKNKEVAMERDFTAHGKDRKGLQGHLKGAEVVGRRKTN